MAETDLSDSIVYSKVICHHSHLIGLINMAFPHLTWISVMFLDEEEEAAAAEEEDEEELQLPALDGLSSSPGQTGLCSADTDGRSPGEDADSTGEGEIRGTLTPEC